MIDNSASKEDTDNGAEKALNIEDIMNDDDSSDEVSAEKKQNQAQQKPEANPV